MGLSLPTPKIGIEKPEGLAHLRVFLLSLTMEQLYPLLPTGIIAYAILKCNIPENLLILCFLHLEVFEYRLLLHYLCILIEKVV